MKFGVILLNGRRRERQDSVEAKQEDGSCIPKYRRRPADITISRYRLQLARLAASMYNNKRSAEVAQG